MAKTTTTIGTVTTSAGSEYTPAGVWPNGEVHVAADGRAIVVYCYWLNPSWHFCYRFSDPTRSTWSNEVEIYSGAFANASSNIYQVSSCLDANGHVHVAMKYYKNVLGYYDAIDYVKLTKLGDGWTTGVIQHVTDGWFTYAPTWVQVHIAHDGTWPLIALNGIVVSGSSYPYGICYRYDQNAFGVNWTTGYGSGEMANYVACHIAAHAGWRVFTWKRDSAADPQSNSIKVVVGHGVSALAQPAWDATWTVLWSGASLVATAENYAYFGLNAVYIGHILADFVVIARLSDNTVRLRQYKIGTGWLDGDVILKSGGTSGAGTRAVWDADAGVLHVWYDTTHGPVDWNPSTGTVVNSGMTSYSSQVFPYMVDSCAMGFNAGGAAGVSTLSFTEDHRAYLMATRQQVALESRQSVVLPRALAPFESRIPLFRVASIPLAGTGWDVSGQSVPIENRKMLPPLGEGLALEKLATFSLIDTVPFDALMQMTPGLARNHQLPLDIRTTWERTEQGSVEWRQGWPWRAEGPAANQYWIEILKGVWTTQELLFAYKEPIVVVSVQDLQLEIPGGVGREVPMCFEGLWPLTDSVYHTWAALRMALGILPHTWRVVPSTQAPTMLHQWTVLGTQGGQVPHLWRVLSPALVALWSSDIQLPYGIVVGPDQQALLLTLARFGTARLGATRFAAGSSEGE